MSTVGRALGATTGHPALKLVLLTVAASPGWPTMADVAAGAELDHGWTRDALAELVRQRLVVEHTGEGPNRYGLPDDGWSYTRDDTDRDDEPKAATPVPPDVAGHPMSTGKRAAQMSGRMVAA